MSEVVPTIGTHSGTFHCDEALACFMLRRTSTYRNARVVRSRDPAVLAALPIIVDVGGEFDVARGRLDHHQRGFEETFSPKHTIKLSSAGLVYKFFGREVVRGVLEEEFARSRDGTAPPVTDELVDLIYLKVYDGFVLALDGIDNGVSQYPAEAGQPRYASRTDLSSRVGGLNPRWNETSDDADLLERFERASAMAGSELLDNIRYMYLSWFPARAIVAENLARRHEADASGRILLLRSFVAWPSHLEELEKEQGLEGDTSLLYALFADRDGSWRVQAVKKNDTFASRKALPAAWRGLRDDALSAVTGIPGCVFAHASGFIGGNRTFEGALAMARAALAAPADEPAAVEPAVKKARVEA